jgi:hypothetical protein
MMKEGFVKQWLYEQGVALEHMHHVLDMCIGVLDTREGKLKHGNFVEAITRKDWDRARLIADIPNRVYLPIYQKFVEFQDEDELIEEIIDIPQEYQYCPNCYKFVTDFPYKDSDKCQSCYEREIDIIHDQVRDAKYETFS